MKDLDEAVLNYISMPTSGALLLNGHWGSGKSHYVKNELFPKIESRKPIIVSLFGASSVHEILERILTEWYQANSENYNKINKNTRKIIKGIAKTAEQIFNSGNILSNLSIPRILIEKIKPEDIFLCLDDLERIKNLNEIKEFIGFINDLTENKNWKILVIANEKIIGEGIEDKEKFIEKTIEFEASLKTIINQMISSQYPDLEDFFNAHKTNYLIEFCADLKEEYSLYNLRILKFCLSHFNEIYPLIPTNVLHDSYRRNIWTFICAFTIEHKKPNGISLKDKSEFGYYNALGDVFFGSFSQISLEGLTGQSKIKEDITSKYYSKNNEAFIFYESIFDFLVAGKTVNKVQLANELKDGFYVLKDGVINPAHELLNSLTVNTFNYNNQDFKEELSKLFNHFKNGELIDLKSYLRAYLFLIKYNSLISLKTNDLYLEFNKQTNNLIKESKDLEFIQYEISTLLNRDNEEEAKHLVKELETFLHQHEESKKQRFVNDSLELFNRDISAFLDKIWAYKYEEYPTPMFTDTSFSFMNEILNLEPSYVDKLSIFFDLRYTSKNRGLLKSELPFLHQLNDFLLKQQIKKESLSNIVIIDKLMPSIKNSINHLTD